MHMEIPGIDRLVIGVRDLDRGLRLFRGVLIREARADAAGLRDVEGSLIRSGSDRSGGRGRRLAWRGRQRGIAFLPSSSAMTDGPVIVLPATEIDAGWKWD